MKYFISFLLLLAPGLRAQNSEVFIGAADILAKAAPGIEFQELGFTNITTALTAYPTVNSYVVDANALAVAVVVTSKASAPETPTFAGNGLSWTQLTSTNYNADVQRITVFTAMTNANTPSGQGTASGFTSETGGSVYVFELKNVATSSTIVQVAKATNATANASITLGAISGGGRNAVVFCAGEVAGNGAAWGVPEAGFTEARDIGYNTPATGLYVMYSLATTDNTPSVTSSASQWGAIAFEVAVKP